MPHKRAKRPARERPTDVSPKISIEHEPIPKSVSRVLDARMIRREYRIKKRRPTSNSDNERDVGFKIDSGETVNEFNRRVERAMAPLVRTALHQSFAQARRVRKEEATLARGKQKDGPDPHPSVDDDEQDEVKEFRDSAPRRLSDIAREPPVFEKFPRGAVKNDAASSSVLSMAQKAVMEEERDKAIRYYRELKARKQRNPRRMIGRPPE